MSTTLYILSILSIIGSLLPIIDSEHWIIRGQSYLRAIYLGLNLTLLILLIVFANYSVLTLVLIIMLALALIVCLRSVITFTPLSTIDVELADNSTLDKQCSILVFNVYQFNDKYDKFLEVVNRVNPDIIFLIETNTLWAQGLSPLKESYPFSFGDVRENTYGLMLFSKIQLLEGGINYFVKPDIPSAEILISINSSMIRILGIHPRPPIPGESYSSKSKDKELVQAANYLNKQEEDDHQILIGDLNDVAWSRASRLFKRSTGMQDPRAGRGFYSTFPTYSLIKMPIDHFFCTPKIKMVDFRVLENIGSDHFPVNVIFHIPDKN